jgi:hypothetical protein
MYRIWYSTKELAEYIINNTKLKEFPIEMEELYESDASNPKYFHTIPDHIKKILYQDAFDLIVEKDFEPIFTMEISTEAGTGHNVFQRFARLAVSLENNVPAFYIYPEGVIVTRRKSNPKWDKLNPLIFRALSDVMNIYHIPALFYYFPSDYRDFPSAKDAPNRKNKGLRFSTDIHFKSSPDPNDAEMQKMFEAINVIIDATNRCGVIEGRYKLLGNFVIRNRTIYMQEEYFNKNGNINASPVTATKEIPTRFLLNYLRKYQINGYKIGELLSSRDYTIIYQVDAYFRGDPYPGALAAIDYLLCREGKTYEERKKNLVLLWGRLEIDDASETIRIIKKDGLSINDFFDQVKASEKKNLLKLDYSQLRSYQIPRYYMLVRYGSTFSKNKNIRVISYFADAILFPDGSLWRDG